MNKIIALAVLTLFIIALVPELGVVEQGHNINTTASTKYVTVLFILNESKTIFLEWGPSMSYYYINIPSTGYAEVPANTTIFIFSDYPFEVNGSPAYISIWPGANYVYFINFTHNTVVYINFVQNKSLMRIIKLGNPVTSNSTSTTSTTEMPQTQIPTEDVIIGVTSSILAVAVAIIALARLGKKKGNK